MSLPDATNLIPPYITAAEGLKGNPEQWQAYESKGNCVVLAGPGSGKTKTLTIKMARMLTEDVLPPRGVACITYNTECAGELKRRLERLGVNENRNVFVGTVHGFCLKNILIPYAQLAGLNLSDQPIVALPSEQERVFIDAFADVISQNADPANWRTGFDKYRRTHLDRNAPAWKGDDAQFATLIEKYEALLRQRNMLDFDDMVLLGLQLIESNEWVRRCLRARFPILIVDEYQDLGLPLHRIVQSLCFGTGVRLFAVGDPDQSIYGFTGAKPELLNTLAETPGIERVHLRLNYRSGQTIIDASETALGEKRGYTSNEGSTGTISFYKCPDGLKQQAKRICAEVIPAALSRREGRRLGDVAVLYLNRYDGDVIETAAQNAGMQSIRMDQGAAYPRTPLTRWLEQCAAWCAGGWEHGTPRLSTLIRAWESLNLSIRTEAELHTLKLVLVGFLFSHRMPERRARDWLVEARQALLVDTLKREPSLRDETVALEALFRGCGPDGKLVDITVAGFGGQGGSPDHLNLITLHSAKGLEFDVVVMMGMDQGKMPSYAAKTVDSQREPRRLFYVGLTRARHEVHITFSGFMVNRSGRRFDNGPSEFVIEVAKRLREGSKKS
jgi:DNA helicase-2/ATP-dependent DNA helicase PcrA